MLFRSTEAMKNSISGVILYDETIRQKAKDGTPLVDIIKAAGSIPGIKVDTGAKPLAGPTSSVETVTEGLDGLRERLAEYHKLGARFAKWRAVITITERCPTYNCPQRERAGARALRRALPGGRIVPIVEPEVLMDGEHASHDIDSCYEVTQWTLKEVFQQLYYANVNLEGTVLKPNMVIAGQKSAKQASASEVAEKTVKCLKERVPPAVPGIAFLSGGQSDEAATEHLIADERDGPAAMGAHVLVRARPAGCRAQGLGRQARKRRRRPACLHAPRQDERAGRAGQMGGAARKGCLRRFSAELTPERTWRGRRRRPSPQSGVFPDDPSRFPLCSQTRRPLCGQLYAPALLLSLGAASGVMAQGLDQAKDNTGPSASQYAPGQIQRDTGTPARGESAGQQDLKNKGNSGARTHPANGCTRKRGRNGQEGLTSRLRTCARRHGVLPGGRRLWRTFASIRSDSVASSCQFAC